MDNGAFLQGQLWSYNPGPEENDDREMIIRSPKYRSPNGDKLNSLDTAVVTVSAKNMRFVMFNYLKKNAKVKGG